MYKWLKQLTTRDQQSHLKQSQNQPRSLSFDRHAIALGVAIGLFCCVLPIFQMILASFLAILTRANLPIAALLTWINNPLTFLPLTYFTYIIGNHFIDENNKVMVIQEFNWKYGTLHEQWLALSSWILQFGKPYFVGLVILAFGLGLLGYCLVMIPWKRLLFFLIQKK